MAPPPDNRPDRRGGRRRRGGGGRRRSRKRGRKGEGRPKDGARDGAAAAARALPGATVVDTERPADEPLSADEVAEMRRHLDFIRRYRKVLRLKLNATENLLVDGAKAPEHRGVCKHLLSKVNRAGAVAALVRKPVCDDPKARAGLLAGVARISGDVAVLLMYLDTLAEVAGREAASAAFAATVERIDFAALSPAQMGNLLGVLERTFEGHERVQVLFGLLHNDSFRRAFDACAQELDGEIAGRFVPLWAVHDAYLAGGRGRRGRRRRQDGPEVEAGLRLLLSAPKPVLEGYRQDVREALLRAALKEHAAGANNGGIVRTLLGTFPEKSDPFRRHAWEWAGRLLAREEDAAATALLRRVAQQHPGDEEVAKLLEALLRPRLGRFSLEPEDDAAPRPGLRTAWWLDRRQPVLLRVAPPEDAARLAEEAVLQAGACLPGLLSVVASGTTAEGVPWIVLPATLPSLVDVLPGTDGRDLPVAVALALAADGVRILSALALAGITLPDVAPRRFVGSLSGGVPVLLLADLDGASAASPGETAARHRELAVEWSRAALAFPPFSGRRLRRETPDGARRLLEEDAGAPPELAELARTLDAAGA